jgi:anti-sigma factor RsiW
MANSTHLPFEEWLLSDTTLSPQEARSLREHLSACPACRQLSAAWREVESQIKTAPSVLPAPGFTARWQVRLEEDRLKLQRRQNLAILLFCVGGAALLLASLGLLALQSLQSYETLVWAWVYQLFKAVTLAGSFRESFAVILRTAADVIPISVWILAAGILSELIVLWVVTLRLFMNPRRIIA